MKKMDALEFYKSHESAPLPDIGDLLSLTVEEICELMEQYHQSKVNNGVLDDVSGSFKLANQTGRLMFKFDNDEPQECATIYDYGKVTIEMQQQKELDNNLQQITNSVEFTSKDGKKFRLFIENCH